MPVYTQDEEIQGLDAKTTPVAADFVVLGDSADPLRTAKKVTFANFVTAVATYITTVVGGFVNSVTGLNTDNTDPKNPIVKISVDGVTVVGLGTPGSPLSSIGGSGGGGGGGTKVAIDTTPFSHTGDTLETSAYIVQIPANTLGINDAIRFTLIGEHNIPGTTVTVKAKYNGTTFTTVVDGGSGQPGGDVEIVGYLIADGAVNAQIGGMRIGRGVTTGAPDLKGGADDGTSITENSAITQNLEITVQLSSAGDTVSYKTIIVEEISAGAGIITTIFPQPAFPFPSMTTTQFSGNTTAYTGLINIPQKINVNDISFKTLSGTSSGQYKIGIYSEDGQTQLLDQTSVTVSSNGVVYTTTLSSPLPLPAGNYYLVILPIGTATTTWETYTADTSNTAFDVTGKKVLSGRMTVTANTLPATLNPNVDITSNNESLLVIRFDN